MRKSQVISAWLLLTAAACPASDGLPRGCDEMPYFRYEAESGQTSGAAVSRTCVDFDPANTASEASGRHYIGLPENGASVAWNITRPANGATLRFTLPDDASGNGVIGTLDVLVNNTHVSTIQLGSYWAWTYFETAEPQNMPGARPRMRFDEIRFSFANPLQPGDELRITKTNGDAHEYGIDFIETEEIPAPLSIPAGFVSVADHGASGTDELPDSDAFDAAWLAAKSAGTGLYIPPGKYVLSKRWNLGNSNGLAIQGAGIWHTELFFSNKATGAGGILAGKNTAGIEISHFYMNSALNERHIVPGQVAEYKAINGPLGAGSSIHHLWMNHFEAGAWLGDYSSPVSVTTGLQFYHNRVRGMYADGINLTQGTSDCVVAQCDFRSCGDDAVAVWTSNAAGAPEGHGNVIQNCTIEFTYRAAAIAIFGGYGHEVHHCLIRGGTDSSGIRFTEDFPGYHFQNNTGILIYQNTFDGQGTSRDLWNNARGAIEVDGAGVKCLDFDDNEILNSPRHAIQLGGGQSLTFDNTTIQQTGLDAFNSPGGAAIHQYGPAGNADFTNLLMSGIESTPPVIRGNPDYILEIHNTLQQCPFEMEIGFPGYNRATVLLGYPVLVKLGPHLPGFSYATFVTPDGSNLRFRDAANRELEYEIESWNPSGTSFVWVRVPALEPGTVIHAAWGNPDLTNAPGYSEDGSVWSSSYAAVYHANGGTGTRRDSSAYGRHGTPIGETTTAPGMIAGADVFDGDGDAVRLPSGFGLFNGSKPVTVEFWFKADSVAPGTDWQTSPVLFEARAENSWMLTFGDSMPADSLSPRLDQSGWNTPASAGGIATGTWRHFAASYVPSGTDNWKIYLDGMLVSQGTRTGSVAAAALRNHYGGSDEVGTTRWFDGMMDEIRISSQARGDDWMWMAANQVSLHGTFTSYGPVTGSGLLADPDGDGQTTGMEIVAGTDPMDATSRFSAWIERSVSGNLRLYWSSTTGRSYRVERAENPAGPWEIVDSAINATPPVNEANPAAIGPASFFRVAVE